MYLYQTQNLLQARRCRGFSEIIVSSAKSSKMKNYLMGQQDPCIKDILQRLENTKKILDKLSKNTKRTFNGERFIPDSELSSVLKISRRTLSEYRSAGILPYYLISGKILYKESDVQQMLEKAYRPSFDVRNIV